MLMTFARRDDSETTHTVAVDVTSSPGGWNLNKGVLEELFQEMQKMAHQLKQADNNGTSSLVGEWIGCGDGWTPLVASNR
jgi:hypothetical protein